MFLEKKTTLKHSYENLLPYWQVGCTISPMTAQIQWWYAASEPLLIVNSVCHIFHDSLFPHCSHPNLPTLHHVVLLWCQHALPLLLPQCLPFFLPCHTVTPYYIYMKGEVYCNYLFIYPVWLSITQSIPIHQRLVIPGAVIYIPLNDQSQCWSPA